MNLTYNGQSLPGVLQDRDAPITVRMRVSDVARGAAYSQGGVIDAKRIKVRGLVKCYSVADQQTKEDDIAAKLPVGQVLPLVLVPSSNRYYPAEVESISFTRNERNSSLVYEVGFYVPGGCAVATNESSVGFPGGSGTVTLSAGNERVRPRISVSFGFVSANASVTFTNTATGEALTFAPTTTDTRILDTHLESITFAAGSIDKTAEWVSGDFPTLIVGANPFTLTTTNCQVTNYTFYFRPRWR